MWILTFALALGLAQEPAAARLAPQTPLTESTLDAYRELIAPSAEDESWREIPWRATFWQGVIDAQAADKPVMLFTMNGHPFGCT